MTFPNEYNEIGRLLWSIFPEDSAKIICEGHLFDSYRESTIYWFDMEGTENSFEFKMTPQDVVDSILDVLISLQSHEHFKKEAFTHFKITLANNGKIKIDFAYISRQDSWPGLYMRGVSELALEEARQYYIPEKNWIELGGKHAK